MYLIFLTVTASDKSETSVSIKNNFLDQIFLVIVKIFLESLATELHINPYNL